MGKFSKLRYSSSAFCLSDLYYLRACRSADWGSDVVPDRRMVVTILLTLR
jgi:hypothetical protein